MTRTAHLRQPRATFEGTAAVRYPVAQMDRPYWYALQTRARHEKQTHRCLEAAGLESFPAVVEVEREWADRVRTVRIPLFTSYIFVRIDLARVGEVLRWPGAVDLVRTGKVPTPIRDQEMESVIAMARGIRETGVVPHEVDYFEPGTRVEVVSGPFEGMIGRLLERRGADCVAVSLDAVRMATCVRMDPSCLVRLPEEA